MKRLLLGRRFSRQSTSKPMPAPTSRPAIIAPVDKVPSRNSSQMMTLAAQLGIRPTRPAKHTDRAGLAPKKPAMASSPASSMAPPSTKVIRKMNTETCKVCLMELLSGPSEHWQCSCSHRSWICR